MKIAVLMSTYNGEKFLDEQIRSILAQTGDFRLNLIVRDDGSTDRTQKILEEYAAAGRLRWFTGENLGPAKSFISLLHEEAGYDYYAFADQDDCWYSDKISRAVEQLQSADGPALYFSNTELVNEHLEPLGLLLFRHGNAPEFNLRTVLCNSMVIGCTTVMNAALVKIIQQTPMPETIAMHDAYAARVCAAVGGKILYDHRPSMRYRQHGKNVVGVQTGTMDRIRCRIKQILTKNKTPIDEQAHSIRQHYSDHMTPEAIQICDEVIGYKRSFLSRARLAASKDLKLYSRSNALTVRLSILLGYR